MGELIQFKPRQTAVSSTIVSPEVTLAYQAKILSLDKLQLLEEMVRFQEERSRIGHLTPEMMVNGQHLFRALEQQSNTAELRLLTKTYRRHLEFELKAYLAKA